MEPVIVGSKLYTWGGNSVSSLSSNKGNMWGGMPVSLSSSYEDNLNVYTFDPSGSPPFRLCEGPISRFIPPEFHDNYSDMRQIPVLSIEEKIYVLDPPRIRVFDLVHQSWKDLPHLPCLPNTDFRRCRHFFCGHKLSIGIDSVDTAGHDRLQGGSYIFDTRDEKWEATNTIHYDVMKRFRSSAIEFEGFLIAVIEYELYNEDKGYFYSEDKVIAYKLVSNGIPNWESYQVLHEIEMDDEGMYYLSKCDGGRIWLVTSINHDIFTLYRSQNQTRLTVFQVFVPNDIEGNQTLSVKMILNLQIIASQLSPCAIMPTTSSHTRTLSNH